MTTCNGVEYVEAQLDSFLKQTRLPDELIVCDDLSGDGTLERINRSEVRASISTRVVSNERNLGYAQNFSKVLSMCNGDVVFLSDQDDYWLPTKIEKVLDFFSDHPHAVLAIHDLEFCKEDLSPLGQTKIQRMQSGQKVEEDYVVGMATAIRGDFLRLCLPIPDLPGVTHDRWLHDCAAVVGGKVVLNEVLALYRRHSHNTTGSKAVNADYVTNRWTFLWARFKEPSRLKMLKVVPDSPLVSWLLRQRHILIENGYLDESRIGALVAKERRRTEILRERNRLLHLPRWRRVWGVAKLLHSGGYKQFFSVGSAIKDMVVR
jgi:glycosyltransferase involved in cell wall biosynthesis